MNRQHDVIKSQIYAKFKNLGDSLNRLAIGQLTHNETSFQIPGWMARRKIEKEWLYVLS